MSKREMIEKYKMRIDAMILELTYLLKEMREGPNDENILGCEINLSNAFDKLRNAYRKLEG